MKAQIFLFLCLLNVSMHGMDGFSYNTYQGTPLTPETLLSLAPKMPQDVKNKTDQWMEANKDFVSKLVTTPHPLTRDACSEKTKSNFELIKKYEQEGEIESLSNFNYVLKFKDCDFTVPINRWGSRIAYWVYATDQGSVLDPQFKPAYDCALFEHLPSYQHCSRVAHYLRLIEIMQKKDFKHLKTTPTYLKHIPSKPNTLSDENYVVIQEWVEALKELKQLSEREQFTIRKNISPEALKEMYDALVYAALWDLSANLAVNADDGTYYMLDLEEPFNHKPQFFYFQGQEGRKKYVFDVKDGLERMARNLKEEPSQMQRWCRFAEEDYQLQELFKEYAVSPNLHPE